jgi:NAD+ kinase
MKTLGVITNVTKPRAPDVLQRLVVKARALGMSLMADAATTAIVPGIPTVTEAGFAGVDAVMALGGDGTMLRAARAIGGLDLPLIGVNIGSLGFLTSVAEADLERALDCLAGDNVIFSRRTVADCVVWRGGVGCARYRGLNDVVISSGASSRVVTLNLDIGKERVASYVCDGLIVSTPTGSTGHNLSAGGPIVVPESRAFVISLICPHTLSSRPLVVPDDCDIRIQRGRASERGLLLAVDGQEGTTLEADEVVSVRASQQGVRFIHLPGHSHFAVMSQKLGWKGSSVR